MLALMAQFGVGDHPTHANLLQPVIALAFAALAGGLTVVVLAPLVPRARRMLQTKLGGHRPTRPSAAAERRARAMMDELCPHGWRARITLFGASDEPPAPLPKRRRDWVELDWTEFDGDGTPVGRVRHVVAPTIAAALETMVTGRRTDETLERIERAALDDGARWPDS